MKEKRNGYTDRPVKELTEDLFGVEVYVAALCAFIGECDTPMTISIQGDWGSGKTSMMNMMKANLKSVFPIWFNTWQFSQFDMGNDLAFSMMDVLLSELDCDKDVRKKIIKGLSGFAKKAVTIMTDHALGGESAATIEEFMSGKALDYASEIKILKEEFQKAIDNKLTKTHFNRVVVFVDDLDRLQPSKAVELLEVLKLFLDCDRCVFVLAVDYEVVTLGIKQKFGGEVSEEKGRSFFDKIIQLPFKMPVSNYNIKNYVKEMMERIGIKTDDKEVTLYYNLIKTSIGCNPRSMKRLFNTFELLDRVTKATIINISDDNIRRRVLFAIICVQMYYEKFYIYLTSTQIDEDTFSALRDEKTVEDVLKEIYGIDPTETSIDEIKRMEVFLPHFIDALQIDEDGALSETELRNLRDILRSSVVTSVNASTDEIDENEIEWKYRNKNKDLVKAAAAILKNDDDLTFTPWMPRKARDDVRISDISAWHVWDTELGFNCCLEYYLSRANETTITMKLFVTLDNAKGLEEKFFEIMGENPLKFNTTPQKMPYGRYVYNNAKLVLASDESAQDQIAKVVKKAYSDVKETIESYKNRQSTS
ncbi:MAG: KAP family NTPase [Lachnospiraceae bacterium]|nr:KAP family NTPase [Lachnospiraceae bacterium]